MPTTVRMPAVRKPRLMGVEGVGLAGAGLHREHADDRGQHADGPRAEREDAGPSAGLAPMELNAGTPRMIEATSVTS